MGATLVLLPTLGEQLVLLRRRRNLSQTDLAKAAGIARSTLSRWENGHTEAPSPELFARLITTINASPEKR